MFVLVQLLSNIIKNYQTTSRFAIENNESTGKVPLVIT